MHQVLPPPPPSERQNKGPAFLAIVLLFTILASVFVFLRVYVRIWVKPAFGWDDGMIIFATVSLKTDLSGSRLTVLAPCNRLNQFQCPRSHSRRLRPRLVLSTIQQNHRVCEMELFFHAPTNL